MKKVFKNKKVVASFFITFAVFIYFLIFGNNNFLNSFVKTAFSPVLTLTSKILNSTGELKGYLLTIDNYKEQNVKLKKELTNLKRDNRDVAELKAENERLRELLELKSSLKFKTSPALVVSYEPHRWYDDLIVNKGTESFVKKGAAVISSDGLVGRVDESGAGWARVLTLLNPDTSVGVRVVRSGALAIAEGDRELSLSRQSKLSFIDKNMDIMVGDVLKTTGDSGVYPEDITVGVVLEIKKDTNGEEYALIEPAVDFSALYEVLVTTGTVE